MYYVIKTRYELDLLESLIRHKLESSQWTVMDGHANGHDRDIAFLNTLLEESVKSLRDTLKLAPATNDYVSIKSSFIIRSINTMVDFIDTDQKRITVNRVTDIYQTLMCDEMEARNLKKYLVSKFKNASCHITASIYPELANYVFTSELISESIGMYKLGGIDALKEACILASLEEACKALYDNYSF